MKRSASTDDPGPAGLALAQQFRVIAELAGDIAFVIDCSTCALRYISPGIEALTGHTPQQLAERIDAGSAGPLSALCAALPQRLQAWQAGAADDARQVSETTFDGAHGYAVPVELISTLCGGMDGSPLTLVGLVRDLAPRRQREAQQKRFASMLNHEFRTPLSTIDGAIQRLEATGVEADAATRARYRKIALATDRLIGMLDDYLSPERMAAIGSERAPNSLAPQTLLDEGAAQLRAAGRVVRVDADALPAALRCAPEGLRLALKVLVDNAIAYSPPASPVLLGARVAAGGIELRVCDQGPGVAPDEQVRVFEKFYRGRNADGMPGSGLGLYMARSIVDAHGGQLTVVTPAAGGAEFRLWLPVAHASSSMNTPASP